MEATTFLKSNPLLPHKKFPRGTYKYNPIIPRRGRRLNIITSATQGENDQGEQQEDAAVDDENKIVLRMRIKKLKALESSNSQGSGQPPPWLLEKDDEGVFDLMELLQGYLMKTKPNVAVGVLALLALSVPLSSSVAMVNVLKIVRGLLAGCHVCIDINF